MHTFCCTETKNEESLFMNDDVHSSTNTLAVCNCGNGEEILGTSIEQAVESDCKRRNLLAKINRIKINRQQFINF